MIRQTFPEAQAIDDPVARLTALTTDYKRRLTHVANNAPLHARYEALRLLGVVVRHQSLVEHSGSRLAPIHAEYALTRLGPNDLGPAIEGLTRFHGAA